MNDEVLRTEILRRLIQDMDFEEHENYLLKGRCPECGRREMFTDCKAPWRLQCNRLSKCGVNLAIQDIYPDLFASWSDRYQATSRDPTAAATAYLRDMRRFDTSMLAGCYHQESWFDSKSGLGSATIRFDIAAGVWWERLIDNPQRFERKANFHGTYKGLWWCLPSQAEALCSAKEIWITEGIFDAIALWHHGITAVSILSCVNYPDKELQKLKETCRGTLPQLVWALDNDNAGKKATLKFVGRAKKEGWNTCAAQPPEGKKKTDWNDLHQANKLQPADIKNYRYYGYLLIAPTPGDKAVLLFLHNRKSEFYFEHGGKTWWAKTDTEKMEKVAEALGVATEDEAVIRQAMTVSLICNCYPTALYYQINEMTKDVMYFFKIVKPDEEISFLEFSNAHLASAGEFKKHLLSDKGSLFKGNGFQLDSIIENQLPFIRTVKTIDFIGYAKEYETYIFNHLAVKAGKLYSINDEQFFEIGKLNLKTTSKSIKLHIDEKEKYNESWLNLFWQAFGEKGFAALAFWVGSAFAEQIREEYESFPFLEINGDPGTGKTTMLEILWKLFGRRDYEGFDPSKATPAGRARTFSQVANFPVVLIEGDRTDTNKYKFCFDELKSLYNGNATHTRGVRNGGNETFEPPFRGSICIAQNAQVTASDAVMERIVQIHTDHSHHSQQSREAVQQLLQMNVSELSKFLLLVTLKEKEIMKCLAETIAVYERRLAQNQEITIYRIIKNHALLFALLDAVKLVMPLNDVQVEKTQNYFVQMALERQRAVTVDHPMVITFWEIFDYLTSIGISLNHCKESGIIAINLNQFIQVASDHRQPLPPINELKELLKKSSRRKYITVKNIHSVINDQWNKDNPTVRRSRVIYCWIFEYAIKN